VAWIGRSHPEPRVRVRTLHEAQGGVDLASWRSISSATRRRIAR